MIKFKQFLAENRDWLSKPIKEKPVKNIPTKIKSGLMSAFKGNKSLHHKDSFVINDLNTIKWLTKNVDFRCGSDGCDEIDLGLGWVKLNLSNGTYTIRA